MRTTSPIPLSLYIHFPWCVRKCPYCDFNSHTALDPLPEDAYRIALIQDLEAALPLIHGRPVISLFIGGGTPSLITPSCLDRLMMDIRTRVNILPKAEITLEANPGTFEVARFADFHMAGVTRLSMGIQSFNNAHLKALGRIHSAQDAWQAAQSARQIFDNVNLDLMYGLPNQTATQAAEDLATALACEPTHLSCYQLTIEPNTAFATAPPPLPEADACADIQEMLEKELAKAGFEHYEVSAFARPGERCQHNLNYWLFGDYLGIGAGAHSKLTCNNSIVRQMRWKHPQTYLEKVATGQFIQTEHTVTPEQLPGEFMMNALRLRDGFHPDLFFDRTGLAIETQGVTLQAATSKGLLVNTPQNIRPTPQGMRFLNPLLEMFL